MIGSIITWILLGICCVYDLAYKQIPLLFMVIGGVIGGILTWVEGTMLSEVIFAMLPGSVMLLAGFFSGEKIGYGDGTLLIALGLLEGGRVCLWDMGIGLVLLVLFAAMLLLIKRANGKTTLPFVPFLLVAHIMNAFL